MKICILYNMHFYRKILSFLKKKLVLPFCFVFPFENFIFRRQNIHINCNGIACLILYFMHFVTGEKTMWKNKKTLYIVQVVQYYIWNDTRLLEGLLVWKWISEFYETQKNTFGTLFLHNTQAVTYIWSCCCWWCTQSIFWRSISYNRLQFKYI